ncbi:hypothetical protein Ciccas_000689 [Cichlidogyrus casuarinus]|uniref:ATP-dependent Clp protease ATP-binding subunit clpX-like, mitochondrial n=1 Tax=Cichlidogyrus casuarinus TaxID=1844966 RepID=A0ABD2QM94_9PLAT
MKIRYALPVHNFTQLRNSLVNRKPGQYEFLSKRNGSGGSKVPFEGTSESFSATVHTDNTNKTKGSGGGSSLNCTKCGQPLRTLEPPIISRFMKCDNCQQLYTLIDKNALKIPDSANQEQNAPPYPKQIHNYLDKHVIGQEQVKKILSVQVYSHYNRIFHNELNKQKPTEQASMGFDQVYPDYKSSSSSVPYIPGVSLKPGYASTLKSKPVNVDSRILQDNPAVAELLHLLGGDSAKGQEKGSLSQPLQKGDEQQSGEKPRGSSLLREDGEKAVRLDKSNIILLGPTGSGKTLLAQTLANCLEVPFAICDCTTLTQAGYVGEDIESVIAKLLQDANYNVEKAQQGIIFLDEVDKIASKTGAFHSIRDVGGEGGMLKLLEGSVVNVPDGKGSRKLRGDTVPVDTTNILFIASGAFNGLDRIISRRKDKRALGFTDVDTRVAVDAENVKTDEDSSIPKIFRYSAELDPREIHAEKDKVLMQVEACDLIEYGIIPEFVGRFPIVTALHSLNEEMLMRILTEPQNALMKQYKLLFEIDNCELTLTEDSLRQISKKALKNQTGARGLRAILEDLLLSSRYEIPGSNISQCIINEKVVLGQEEPRFVYRDKAFAGASS